MSNRGLLQALSAAKKAFWSAFEPTASSQPDYLRSRPGSLPFISGDTFRGVAEVIIEEGGVTERLNLDTGVIFASAGSLESNRLLERLATVLERKSTGHFHSLVIHNGDQAPSPQTVRELLTLVPRMFSTNVLDGQSGLTPVPIGLENVARNHNGRLHYYLDALASPTPESERARQVLSSFHESNNPEIRRPTQEILTRSRHGHEQSFRKSLDYRLEVRRTKFVISPPGNGIDTHRTWEAMYLGAVPVVLNGYLAESLTSELPIMVVESYEDFCGLSDAELNQLYLDYREKPMTKAWGHYWLNRVLNESRS